MEILHEINLARFWKLFLSYKKTFIIVWIATAALGLNDWLQHTPEPICLK